VAAAARVTVQYVEYLRAKQPLEPQTLVVVVVVQVVRAPKALRLFIQRVVTADRVWSSFNTL
jgi:hypothetical protein